MIKNKQSTLIMLVLFALAACTSPLSTTSPSTLMPPNGFTQAYEPLQNEIADSLIEVDLLSSPSNTSRLLKVGYINEDNTVVGIYGDGGTVVGWKTDTATIAFTHNLGIVTSKALVLINSGEYLIGATEQNFGFQKTEYVNGIGLWDVHTGTLIKCLTFPCEGTPLQRDGFLGLAVDANGKWLSIYSEYGISLSSVFSDSPNMYIEPTPLDSSYHWQIGSVAFDEVNGRYVIIFQEGRIYVSDIERPLIHRTLTRGNKGDYEIITEAIIDPTGRWLAMARGDKTQVLNLDKGTVLLEIKVSNPVLSFDQVGELLFVGSSNRLAIYGIETSEKIAEYDTVGITSLAISEDNRLVIWGDRQGAIHVWGVPLVVSL